MPIDWDKIDFQDTNTIMQLYRGEIQRSNTWRKRMDRTTHWSIVITVGVLTWALSSSSSPHWALLPGLFLVYVLLLTEARRYRYYDIWRGRIRVLEERFLAKFFDRDLDCPKGWEIVLSKDFLDPKFKISLREALKRRLKRIYIWIILIFVASWLAKIYIHPELASSPHDFLMRAAESTGVIQGVIILALVLGFVIVSSLYLFLSVEKRKARGKVEEAEKEEKFATEDYIEEEIESKKDNK